MRPRYPHWRDDLIRANRPVREATNKVLEMVDNGILNPRDVLLMALKWMSEDDVKEMAEANELFEEDEDEDEDDEEDEEEFFDPDGRRAEMPWDYGRHFDDEEEDEEDEDYSDYSEEELRKMGCFDNLNEEIDDEED